MQNTEHSLLGDHSQQPEAAYRAIDHELAEAEREMHDVDEQLRALHERQKRRKKLRFTP